MSKNSKLTIYLVLLAVMLVVGSIFGRSLFSNELAGGDAVEYNNYFVNKQQEVISELTFVQENLPKSLTREEGDQIITSAIGNIDDVVGEVRARDAIINGEDLKKKSIETFEEYQDVIKQEYSEYLDVAFAEEEQTIEEIDKKFEEINLRLKEKLNSADEKFIEAQQEFSTKTGIILQGR